MQLKVKKKKRKLYVELARAAIFYSDRDEDIELGDALEKNPARFDFTELEKIAQDRYQIGVSEVDSGRTYNLEIPRGVLEAPWTTPLVREANFEI